MEINDKSKEFISSNRWLMCRKHDVYLTAMITFMNLVALILVEKESIYGREVYYLVSTSLCIFSLYLVMSLRFYIWNLNAIVSSFNLLDFINSEKFSEIDRDKRVYEVSVIENFIQNFDYSRDNVIVHYHKLISKGFKSKDKLYLLIGIFSYLCSTFLLVSGPTGSIIITLFLVFILFDSSLILVRTIDRC